MNNSPLSDLFGPIPNKILYGGVALSLLDTDDRTHDTSEIMELYLVRPQWQAALSLGVWFCRAHKLADADLKLSASGQLTKKLIWMRGYNQLKLDPLIAFNKQEKPQS